MEQKIDPPNLGLLLWCIQKISCVEVKLKNVMEQKIDPPNLGF